MKIELVPATLAQVPELGDICFRAFQDISQRHGFENDFESSQFAQMVVGGLIRNESCYSVAALLNGTIAGSNFLSTPDVVGAVGPISVDPEAQGSGIGRALMEDVLRHAKENGIEQVRLMQDAFNMTSLSLYASLGFDTKVPVALLEPAPAPDILCRPLSAHDLDAVDELSRRIYRVSRRNEVEHHMTGPFKVFVRERAGRVVGYLITAMPGHGVAETEDDMLGLILHSASTVPPEATSSFCPLTEGTLYRRLLAAGCRTRKVMNLMALGPYEEPHGVWIPSVGF
jgi:predicted N-acetyltransferase YhbS